MYTNAKIRIYPRQWNNLIDMKTLKNTDVALVSLMLTF